MASINFQNNQTKKRLFYFLTPSSALLLFYIMGTRLGWRHFAYIGLAPIGIPIFITDITLGLCIMFLAFRFLMKPSSLQTDTLNTKICLFFGMALLFAIVALPRYGLFALRDLAIFGYILFYPVTIAMIKDKKRAEMVVKIFLIGSIAVFFVLLCGILFNLPFISSYERITYGGRAAGHGGGDVGGILAGGIAGMMGYILYARPKGGPFLVALTSLILCLIGLFITQTRSALLGVIITLLFFLFLRRKNLKKILILMVILSILIGGVIAVYPRSTISRFALDAYLVFYGGLTALNLDHRKFQKILRDDRMYYYGFSSAGEDANAYFRFARWLTTIQAWWRAPLFGIPFGKPLKMPFMQSEGGGKFNAGMPHNTYLYILVRSGIVGLSLLTMILASWFLRMSKALRAGKDWYIAAVLGMAITMTVYGFFTLFFERPYHAAPFWILLGVGTVLMKDRDGYSNNGQVKRV